MATANVLFVDKAEDFSLCLLRDVAESFCAAAELNVTIPAALEKERCVPKEFFANIYDFCKPFLEELTVDIAFLPIVLFASPEFFRRFGHSVCLKLSETEDDEIAFLKVTVFFVVLTASAFGIGCYRVFEYMTDVYYIILKDHLKTSFYREGKFEEIILKSKELQSDERWQSKCIEEMRVSIAECCSTELAVTKIDKKHTQGTDVVKILDVRNRTDESHSDKKCKYCEIQCILLLNTLFLPKTMYKPKSEE